MKIPFWNQHRKKDIGRSDGFSEQEKKEKSMAKRALLPIAGQ